MFQLSCGCLDKFERAVVDSGSKCHITEASRTKNGGSRYIDETFRRFLIAIAFLFATLATPQEARKELVGQIYPDERGG